MAHYFAHKKDTVHKPITKALIIAGCGTLDLSPLGRGAPDDLITRGDNFFRLFEYKTEKGKLRTEQIEWLKRNPRLAKYYRIIRTKEEAFKEMGLL